MVQSKIKENWEEEGKGKIEACSSSVSSVAELLRQNPETQEAWTQVSAVFRAGA